MSVELDPVELGFMRPFQHEVAQILRLKNPHADPVAFKVKTTAPKQYCVRPNSGRIEPGEQVEVQILLQAMKEDPPPDAKCRDKFLVQSVLVTADHDFANVGSLWTHMEQTSKSSIQEKKIRVLFLPAEDATSTPAQPNGRSRESLVPSSPSPDAVTPQRAVLETAGPVSVAADRPAGSKNLGDLQKEAFNPAHGANSKSTLDTAATRISNALPSSASLQAQLDEAKAEIVRLTQQAGESSGLRQRKTPASTSAASPSTLATAAPAVTAGGVPVHITAGLCLVSFLLAYFLF